MVETITPVVHGGRRASYRAAVALHALGAAVSAALFGAAAGAVGAAMGAPWNGIGLLVLSSVAVVYAARELLGIPAPLPDRRRQVPDWWRTFFAPKVAALLYGLGLGIGFMTYLSYGTLVAVAIAALASGDPLVGAVACAPFGLARALSVWVANRSRAALPEVVDRLDALAQTRVVGRVNGVALVAIALAAGWTL